MNSRFLVCTIVVVLILSPYSEAQVPKSWSKVETTTTGTQVIVSLKNGTLVEGFLKSAGTDDMTVVLPNGADFHAVKSDVREIRTRYRDSNKNGTLIGLTVGAGLGAATAAATNDEPIGFSKGGFVAVAGLFYGAIGALIGYMVDNTHKHTELIYRAQ